MKDIKIRIIKLIPLILLYYIKGDKSIFLYVMSLSLYNIFSSCFKNISIKEELDSVKKHSTKLDIYKQNVLSISVLSLIFLMLSLLVSTLLEKFFIIKDSFIVFLLMGLSILKEPLYKITYDLFANVKSKKICHVLKLIIEYLEPLLLIITEILLFIVFKLDASLSNALLYIPSILLVLIIIIPVIISTFIKKTYRKINIKNIFEGIDLPLLIKNSYWYISIIMLYLIFSKRYTYMLDDAENIITFIYFYLLNIFILFKDIIEINLDNNNKLSNIVNQFCLTFDRFLSISIVISIISKLISKVLCLNNEYSEYIMMFGFLIIFISLYELLIYKTKDKKIIEISLILGIITKIIVVIPLIDSFYRLGYNIVYGDIISSIFGFIVIIVINYIYTVKTNKDVFVDKLLTSVYENLIICIVLILIQFIIPTETDKYFSSLIILIIYIVISIFILRVKNEKKVEKLWKNLQ